MNLELSNTEAGWVLEALRAYVRTPAFGNDPEDVRRMSLLLTKLLDAERLSDPYAGTPYAGIGPDKGPEHNECDHWDGSKWVRKGGH